HMAKRHGLSCTQADLDDLKSLIGGHPYLIRLALFQAATSKLSISDAVAPRAGVFTDYLQRYRRRLNKDPALFAALREVWSAHRAGGSAALAPQLFERLRSAGLIILDDAGACRLRYRLYEQLVT